MSASPTLPEVRLGLEHDRKLVTDQLRRELLNLAHRATGLAENLDRPSEVSWMTNHAQGFSYDVGRIERDLAKLDLLNGVLTNLGEEA